MAQKKDQKKSPVIHIIIVIYGENQDEKADQEAKMTRPAPTITAEPPRHSGPVNYETGGHWASGARGDWGQWIPDSSPSPHGRRDW